MKIRMKVDLSGLRDGRPWPPRGEVAEVPDVEGADLCAAGAAEPVADPPAEKAETAKAPEPEKRAEPAEESKQRRTPPRRGSKG